MTINSQTNKVIYTGNGVATEFAIPFSFLEQGHIKVRQKLGDIQTERTDWTVKDGNLIFADAPETGAEIAVIREVPLTQETDYRENEILPAETLERDFDKLTMQVQQLKEQIDRAVTVDVFDDTQAASLIPSIRQAVSDCQTAVATTAANAQTATEQAAASSASAANAAAIVDAKANADLSNCSRPYVTETYKSDTGWYRVWSDGWIEQGGNQYGNGTAYVLTHYVSFLKPFTQKLATLSLAFGGYSSAAAYNAGIAPETIPSLSGFQFNGCHNGESVLNAVSWYACGY